jgi:hypothetical protein
MLRALHQATVDVANVHLRFLQTGTGLFETFRQAVQRAGRIIVAASFQIVDLTKKIVFVSEQVELFRLKAALLLLQLAVSYWIKSRRCLRCNSEHCVQCCCQGSTYYDGLDSGYRFVVFHIPALRVQDENKVHLKLELQKCHLCVLIPVHLE